MACSLNVVFFLLFTGKEHWIVATESVSSSGTFWARVVRTSKEEASFVGDMERMGLVLLLALYFLCDCIYVPVCYYLEEGSSLKGTVNQKASLQAKSNPDSKGWFSLATES